LLAFTPTQQYSASKSFCRFALRSMSESREVKSDKKLRVSLFWSKGWYTQPSPVSSRPNECEDMRFSFSDEMMFSRAHISRVKISTSQFLMINPVFLGVSLKLPGRIRQWFATSLLLAFLRFGGTLRFPLQIGTQ